MGGKDSEMSGKEKTNSMEITRRDFLKGTTASAALLGVSSLPFASGVFAAGSDELKVGLIGCGGRGTGAATDCVRSAPGVRIFAMGDLFQDRLEGSLARLTGNEALKDKIDVTKDRCFWGFDAYEKVIASDVDMVILAAPPGFRPSHFKAAVEAGKHVFFEKPVAVDGPGVRAILEAGEIAQQKKLGIVAGTIKRHQADYMATIKRIHDGEIGDILAAQCYYNTGELWNHGRKPEWSDMEWQCRNWLYFTWLSGDHIVEQHIHNLDVMNWAIGSHPEKCVGIGGRQVRTDPAYGHIFDHFTIEYEYPNGVRLMSMCRQSDNCCNNVLERVIGKIARTTFNSCVLQRQTPRNVQRWVGCFLVGDGIIVGRIYTNNAPGEVAGGIVHSKMDFFYDMGATSEACGPLGPSTTSNSTSCPSNRLRRPLPRIAE